MAVIPRFDGRIGRQLDTSNAAPTVNMYVPPARTSPLEKTGVAIQEGVQKVAKIYEAQQERAAANYTTQKSAELQESTIRNMNDAKKKALETGNVEGFTENFEKFYNDSVSEAVKGAPNKMASELLQQRALQQRASLLQQAMKFEADTKIEIYNHNLDVAADSYAKTAAMDPSQIPSIMKQMKGDMVAARETLGMVDAEDRMRKYQDMIAATAISAQMNDNPYLAKNLINQHKDLLSASDYVSLSNNANKAIERAEKQAAKAKEDAAVVAQVYGAMNGGIPLDPSKPQSKKAVDKLANSILAENPTADLTDIALKTKILPTALKNQLSGQLASGDANQKVQAAETLTRLHDQAPNLVTGMTKNDKAKSSLISSYIRAGVAPAKAVDWAEKETMRKDENTIRLRSKAAGKEDNLKFSAVEGDFTGFFGGGVEAIPDTMRSEYELLAHAYYVDEGLPADKARENALKDIKGIWYKSKTGRERFMKNAPEIAFDNGAGHTWIREQLRQDVGKEYLFEDEKKRKKALDNIILEANPVYTKNGLPVYNVFMLNEDTGMVDMLLRDGEPMLFQPDFEQSDLYKRMLDQSPGETYAEKKQRYLEYMERQQIKQLTRGQAPDTTQYQSTMERYVDEYAKQRGGE